LLEGDYHLNGMIPKVTTTRVTTRVGFSYGLGVRNIRMERLIGKFVVVVSL